MLDKNTKLVYTFAERKSCGLQTAAAGPGLQKTQNQKLKNQNEGGEGCLYNTAP